MEWISDWSYQLVLEPGHDFDSLIVHVQVLGVGLLGGDLMDQVQHPAKAKARLGQVSVNPLTLGCHPLRE